MRIKQLAKGAVLLAVIFISFLLFRGTTNLLNGIFVPISISFFIHGANKRETLVFFLAVFFFTFLFFQFQLVFILSYMILALLLVWIFQKKFALFLKGLIVTFVCFVLFDVSIWLTDWIFALQIRNWFLMAVANNLLIYYGIILLQGTIVGFSLVGFYKIFMKLLKYREKT